MTQDISNWQHPSEARKCGSSRLVQRPLSFGVKSRGIFVEQFIPHLKPGCYPNWRFSTSFPVNILSAGSCTPAACIKKTDTGTVLPVNKKKGLEYSRVGSTLANGVPQSEREGFNFATHSPLPWKHLPEGLRFFIFSPLKGCAGVSKKNFPGILPRFVTSDQVLR